MNHTRVKIVKKFLGFLLVASIVAIISYLIVFKVSFLPNGYDIVEVQKDRISLKSFNLVGIEKNITTATFSEDDTWRIGEIDYEVNRQKEFLWLLFFAVSVSTFLFIYKIRHGMKLWKSVFESNIIFAILIPILPLISSLNRIQSFIT